MTTIAATGVLRGSWLLLAFPIFGAVVLLVGGRRTDKWGHLLGVAMPVASFVYAVIAFFALLGDRDRSQDLHLFSYIPVGGFQVSAGILLDPLSASFMLLITGVGSLIIIYSVGYMAHDSDRRRFFGYMNLFIAAMLLLVLADNYLVLYVGWEGVGVASYLLIGFWQFKNSAAVAAKKAFVVNRVGDAGLTLAIFLMFAEFGTVTFSGVFGSVRSGGSGVATALGLLLLLGACGKSAQVPLQSWLLDAMEGPTPVSALIHAAIPAGQQARAGRRAQRRGMPLRVAHASRRDPVDVGCLDRPPVAAHRREADIIQHDVDDIGQALGRLGRLERCPVRTSSRTSTSTVPSNLIAIERPLKIAAIARRMTYSIHFVLTRAG